MVEFVVWGTPRSQQAKRKKLWKEKVQRAAPSLPKMLTGPLRLRIAFFYSVKTDLDTDNIIKPIQDALEDVLYEDDEVVIDVCARQIDLQRLPSVKAVPPVLLAALAKPARDFVFVRVAAADRGLAFS